MPYDILRAMQAMQQQGAGAAPEDAARRFARRRLLMGLQGGLGAGVEAGGGFFGNLLRGASGSLGGTLQANQMQHEDERQAIKDTADQQRQASEDAYRQRTEGRAIEAGARADRSEDRYIEDQNWQRADRLTPKKSAQESEFDRWLKMTPAERGQYKEYKNIGDAPTKPEKPRAAVSQRIDEINGLDANDPDSATMLQRIIANPMTPEEGAAARAKLQVRPGLFRTGKIPTASERAKAK